MNEKTDKEIIKELEKSITQLEKIIVTNYVRTYAHESFFFKNIEDKLKMMPFEELPKLFVIQSIAIGKALEEKYYDRLEHFVKQLALPEEERRDLN